MTHHYILIVADFGASLIASQIAETQTGIQISIIGSDQSYQPGLKNINKIKESPAFYQPWRNRLITLEGNIFSYDYLFLMLQNHTSHFIRQSLLVDRKGSININRKTSQHNIYKNVFAIDNISEDDPGGKENLDVIAKQIKLSMKSIVKKLQPLPVLSFELAA